MNYKRELTKYGLLLFPLSIALPLSLKLKSIFLIVFFITILFNANFAVFTTKKTYANPVILLFALFVLIEPIVALLRDGVFVFSEVRLSFLIAPILFFASRKFILNNYSEIIKVYLVGIYLYIIYAFLFSIYFYSSNETIPFAFNYYLKYVLYNYLPGAIHHTYLGLYMTFGILIILFGIKKDDIKKILWSLPILLAIILTGSKFSIVIVFLLVLIWSCITLWRAHKKALIMLLLYGAGILYYSIAETDIFRTISNSFDQRIEIFKCAFDGIANNGLLGVGKQGVKPLIKMCTDGRLEMDTHNMYLQEILSSGVLLFIIMLMIFAMLFVKSKGDILLQLFLISFMCFGVVEHLFNLQLGVTYFVFFSLLLWLKAKDQNRNAISKDTSRLKEN